MSLLFKHRDTSEGFTLIELLVVIAIIGLLSSVVLASLNGARLKARDARRLADAKQIQTALELYYDSNNQYPGNSCWWCVSNGGSAWIPGLSPTFIPTVPADPVNVGSPEEFYYYTSNGADYCMQFSQEGDCSKDPNYRGVWSGTCKLRYGPTGPVNGLCITR